MDLAVFGASATEPRRAKIPPALKLRVETSREPPAARGIVDVRALARGVCFGKRAKMQSANGWRTRAAHGSIVILLVAPPGTCKSECSMI